MEKIRVIITNNQKAVKVPTGVRMLIRSLLPRGSADGEV